MAVDGGLCNPSHEQWYQLLHKSHVIHFLKSEYPNSSPHVPEKTFLPFSCHLSIHTFMCKFINSIATLALIPHFYQQLKSLQIQILLVNYHVATCLMVKQQMFLLFLIVHSFDWILIIPSTVADYVAYFYVLLDVILVSTQMSFNHVRYDVSSK